MYPDPPLLKTLPPVTSIERLTDTPGIGEEMTIEMETDIDSIGNDLGNVLADANIGRWPPLSKREAPTKPTKVEVTLGPLPVPEGVRLLVELQRRLDGIAINALSLRRDSGESVSADG